MAADEPEDKSTWALPPMPEDVRAYLRRVDEVRARDEALYESRRLERRRRSDEFRASLKKMSERWNQSLNMETP